MLNQIIKYTGTICTLLGFATLVTVRRFQGQVWAQQRVAVKRLSVSVSDCSFLTF
jgi:hypothetical protein